MPKTRSIPDFEAALERQISEPSIPQIVLASAIRKELDGPVRGQEEAKERLSLLISMYLCWDAKQHPMHQPPNGIIVGPTGSGKTYSIQVASEALKIPFFIFDATTLVPAGAVTGSPIDTLRTKIDDSVRPGQKCIVFLDEFDKLACKEADHNKNWKTDIQRGLLKFIEGSSAFDTSFSARRVLVLVGGAFIGIDAVENQRKRSPEISRLLQRAPKNTIVGEDVINYGFLPELVGRLPAVIRFEPLSEQVLLEILTNKLSSPLDVWVHYFERLHKRLEFDQSFYQAVASRAATLGLGARGLQQVVFPALARQAYAFAASTNDTIEITSRILEYSVGDNNE